MVDRIVAERKGRKPTLLIVGYSQCGKDVVASLIKEHLGLDYSSTTMWAVDQYLWDQWGKDRYGSKEAFYSDRHNHIPVWQNLMDAYCTPDKARQVRGVMMDNDMYVGLRHLDQLVASVNEGLIDHVIWIDSADRGIKPEPGMSIKKGDADLLLNNNGPESNLLPQILNLQSMLYAEGFDVNYTPKVLPAVNEQSVTHHPCKTETPSMDLITAIHEDLNLGAAKNALIFEPKVFAIGQTQFNTEELENWIDYNGLGEVSMDIATPLGRLWEDVSEKDSIARMIEFGGRHCYRAWNHGRDRVQYVRNIMAMEHGSVMEHATINWGIQGVSRSLSLELARHRVGIALSQESQRYVEASDINFVVPPAVINLHAIIDKPGEQGVLTDFHNINMKAVINYANLQRMLMDNAGKKTGIEYAPKVLTAFKKRANEAARAHLPNCTETRFLWTTNMRILQHFLWLRGGLGADLEIRRLAIALLVKAQDLAPEIFDTMTTKSVKGDYGVPIIVSALD